MNPIGGGPVEGVKQLVAAEVGLGCHSEVLSLDDPDDPWVSDFPLPLYLAGPARLRYGWSPNLIPWLKAHHRDYDVVVVNGLWQFTGLAVRHVLRRSETPYCVFTHGMLDPWFKQRYPLKHLKKWLYWPWAEYRILRDAAAVLFTTEEERLQARRSFWLYRCREMVVNYGTVRPEGDAEAQRALFFEAFPELLNKQILLYLGRIHEKKGCDLLIEAFSQHLLETPTRPSLHLVMAGPGDNDFRRKVEGIAERLDIASRITWTGMLTGDLKWGAFHAAEAFVLTSHQENFGIAVAEALACGVPVLISDKVNIWREIKQDNAGLIEADDLPGTRNLLRQWGILSQSERRTMRDNAKACFENRFEVRRGAESLRDVLASCVRKS